MIGDPRKYQDSVIKSNIIVQTALDSINSFSKRKELSKLILSNIEKENDIAINVALNLATSYEVCHVIWDTLNDIVTNPGIYLKDNKSTLQNGFDETQSGTVFFAVPIVVVAGAKKATKLKGTVDTTHLNDFFIKNKIIKADASDFFISGKLISPSDITKIKPSQILKWGCAASYPKAWIPAQINESAIEINGEGVFLRFLIGCVKRKNTNELAGLYLDNTIYQQKSMELMKFLVEQLKTSGVTLFPIPFPLCSLFEAFNVGDTYRIEIACQVSLSNGVRHIREKKLTPYIVLSEDRYNEAIDIKLKAREDNSVVEHISWKLKKIDDFNKIINMLHKLFNDMQVEFMCS